MPLPSQDSPKEGRKQSLASIAEICMMLGMVGAVGFVLFPVVAQAGFVPGTVSTRANAPAGIVGSRYKESRLRGLEQVSASMLQYTGDFDGAFPVGCGANFFQPNDGGWVYGIQPYLPNLKSLVARRDPKSRKAWPDWVKGMPNAINVSYATNGYMKTKDNAWGMYGLAGVDQSRETMNGAGWMTRGRSTQAEVKHPEDTVMLAECYGAYALYGPSDILSGLSWWDMVGVGGLIPDGTHAAEKRPIPYLVNGVVFNSDIRNGGMNARKNIRDKQQIAFADGHIAAIPPISTNPDPIGHPELNKWDIEH